MQAILVPMQDTHRRTWISSPKIPDQDLALPICREQGLLIGAEQEARNGSGVSREDMPWHLALGDGEIPNIDAVASILDKARVAILLGKE